MNARTLRISLASAAAVAAGLLVLTSSAQAPSQAVVGDAARGRQLFSDTFNCYACHGFDAQSGERRLVPMRFPQDGFITFVQSSPLPNMPPFPDASAQQLADIWAYIGTIQADAPAVGELPLLKDILDRKTRAAAQ